ncbi:MAG: metallophosphatase family protein [Candidatus Omnitrophica bacterium]|nr:metallophosphatase family protein [Candidatus Omnitrophota bacterium]
MKIGVISDTHIPVNCESIPDKIRECFSHVDMIIHAGDLTELCVLDELAQITPKVEAVRGNMDSQHAQRKLPQKKIIKAGKFKIGLIHGWGPSKNLSNRMADEFKNVDVIIFGHSHVPVNEARNGVLFFNPGSATDTVFAKERTVGILEITDKIKGTIIPI